MKTLSFIIPVYNEERRLLKTFASLRSLDLPKDIKLEDVIFVNDGSTDNTLSVIDYLISCMKESPTYQNTDVNFRVVSYDKNRGKGYAIREGMLEAKSDYALFFDADMSTPLSEIRSITPQIRRSRDVVIGTRKHKDSNVIIRQSIFRAKMGQVFTIMTGLLFKMKLTDYTCGFKAFSKKARVEVFGSCRIDRWAFDAEILYLSHKYGFSVHEVPVTWKNDDLTKVRLYKDVFLTMIDLAKIINFHKIAPAVSVIGKQLSLGLVR